MYNQFFLGRTECDWRPNSYWWGWSCASRIYGTHKSSWWWYVQPLIFGKFSEVLNYSASRQGCSSTWLSRHETRETVPSNTFVGTPFAHPIPLNVDPQDGIETLAIDHFQYSFVLSCQAFDLKWDLRWPCHERDQYLFRMITK